MRCPECVTGEIRPGQHRCRSCGFTVKPGEAAEDAAQVVLDQLDLVPAGRPWLARVTGIGAGVALGAAGMWLVFSLRAADLATVVAADAATAAPGAAGAPQVAGVARASMAPEPAPAPPAPQARTVAAAPPPAPKPAPPRPTLAAPAVAVRRAPRHRPEGRAVTEPGVAAPAPLLAAAPPAPAPVLAATPAAVPPPDTSPALLSVNAVPWGSVWIDGNPAGTTPLLDFRVSPGAHHLRIARSGYATVERAFEAVAGERIRITGFTLQPVRP